MRRRVVVTGMGVITPIGNSVEEFWNAVREEKTGFGEITHFDASGYKCHLAAEVKNFDGKNYMDPKAAKRMELFCQYAVAATKEAIADAGLEMEKEDPYRWEQRSEAASEVCRRSSANIRSFWRRDRGESIRFWCR